MILGQSLSSLNEIEAILKYIYVTAANLIGKWLLLFICDAYLLQGSFKMTVREKYGSKEHRRIKIKIKRQGREAPAPARSSGLSPSGVD